MDLVKERHIKTAKLHVQLNMPDMEALVTIRQLRFLIRVAKMDESRLTRQVMSSQGVRTKDTNVKGSKLTSTRSAYRNALIRGGVVSEEEKKSCILTDIGHVDYVIRIGEIIETKLHLPAGSLEPGTT